MSRKKARELSMQTLFQMDMQGCFETEYLERIFEEIKQDSEKDDEYMMKLINLFIERQEEIDNEISGSLKDWKLERLPKVELAILRVAVTEIVGIEEIPNKVSINEALNLCKKFSEEKSTKYINGTLGTIIKKYEK